MTSAWLPRFADLAGKAIVVAGESEVVLEVVGTLAHNRALVAVVAPNHDLVQTATGLVDSAQPAAFGFTADPGDARTWERITPHIEQRLGPVDVVITVAAERTRRCVVSCLLPDMVARRRGVVVESGSTVAALQLPPGVRHRGVEAGSAVVASDVAAAVVSCASDVFLAPSMLVTLSGACPTTRPRS